MNLEIYRTAFLEIDKISSVKSHIEKIRFQQVHGIIKCEMDIDMSYRDIDFNECFISIPYKFDLEIDEELEVMDIKLNKLYIYVIEAKGINIEYELDLSYNSISKPIEIIDDPKDDELDKCFNDEMKTESNSNSVLNDNIKSEEEISIEIKEMQNTDISDEIIKEEIQKVKEEISKDYEAKLATNLASRDDKNIKIVSTISKNNTVDFLRLFNNNEDKFRIKTLFCESEEDLNEISKKYKVSISDLLKGYDKLSKRVIFKINNLSSNQI